MATGTVTITSLTKLRGWLWDTTCVGFGARRQRNHVDYYVRYRQNGAQRMHSIGRHGSPWTPDTARTEARKSFGDCRRGQRSFSRTSTRRGAEVGHALGPLP